MAQGCSLSPILFSVFINDLLKEVEQAELEIQLSSGKTFGGMLFADDFVGVSDSKESLQKLIDHWRRKFASGRVRSLPTYIFQLAVHSIHC